MLIMPGQERRAIALARVFTCHTKNTYVVCCLPQILYGVFSDLLIIYLFSEFLISFLTIALLMIALIKSFFCQYSTFYSLLSSRNVNIQGQLRKKNQKIYL